MESILFSFVITIYNVEMYLSECVESIRHQGYSNTEIILVDDGSTDQSYKLCEEFAKKDQRIKLVHQSNMGLTTARKRGVAEATGEYIIFVDADDWIDKDTCQIFAEYIQKYKPDIIVDGVIKEYANRAQPVRNVLPVGYYSGLELEKQIYTKMIFTGHFFEKGIESYICAKAVKREIIQYVAQRIDVGIWFAEGGAWLYACLLKSNSILIVDKLHYHYRMRDNSMTISDNEDINIQRVYEFLIKCIVNNGINVKQLIWQLDYMAMFFLIWKKLPLFNQNHSEKFYPFTNLPKNCKVVVYGAWRFGRMLYTYIRECKFCDIVLWVDQNAETYKASGLKIDIPEKILETEYDYILLGSEVYSVINSMKRTLQNMGIENNVLYINEELVKVSDIPDEFKILKRKYYSEKGDILI